MTAAHNLARPTFSLALHGGAGVMPSHASAAEQQGYLDGLANALKVGRDILADGGLAIDAVEQTVRALEEDERFNAGRGAVYNAAGTHELDAAIMDGRMLACGAVASLTTVKNPISLARLVMEKSGHVLLAGDGAEAFADVMEVERVANSYFDTVTRHKELEEKLEHLRQHPDKPHRGYGTVGAVARDTQGNLAAATSTGGMTAKRFGRVGDSPIIGAGTYADNQTVAVSCTGLGEEFIRHSFAFHIAALMKYKGASVADAVEQMLFKTLKPSDGGIIAVSHTGEIVLRFNTHGMYRGAADSNGRFETHMF